MDHAGEFGADKIYAGQLAVLGPKGTGSLPFVPSSGRKVPAEETGALIQHMWDQEKEHLAAFERLIPKHRARPTALLPIWNIAGMYFIYSNYIKSIYFLNSVAHNLQLSQNKVLQLMSAEESFVKAPWFD